MSRKKSRKKLRASSYALANEPVGPLLESIPGELWVGSSDLNKLAIEVLREERALLQRASDKGVKSADAIELRAMATGMESVRMRIEQLAKEGP